MSVIAVIPARYGSTRFPGKPLHPIAGTAMVERVRRVAAAAPSVDRVIVATDDARIRDAVEAGGGEAVMTPETCRNGTERVFEAVKGFAGDDDVILNLQGDAPLTPPWVIEAVAAAMAEDPSLPMATPAVEFAGEALEATKRAKAAGEVGGTTVVFDHAGNALYFSKAIIPFQRHPEAGTPVYKHVGLYAYRFKTLEELVKLEPSPLERAESLEQLRALENGIPIRVVITDYRGRTPCSVDSPGDAETAEAIIAREGELV
ncbi:3-deoxy-manno-octulosonate cytidylyltransferase [Marinicauda salina]|uniref:3-deoxy-manno-octulosonate cytidylyltransferase n=1 Tax=Marinicauda salina TaxID=2135793 RepID=A0A2U2BXK7_9PROT|nr:3-deoxy-manno-octulosonate cytidylyltransferase [Marinicauda salina]PWE18745.1 3-deoxy-manno-octulosonate cytidylyltransferase [Marinicauda salina]